MSQERYVNCPTCNKKAIYSAENPFRPFCSERCQLIDLGTWADEGYKMPSEEASHSEVNENSDSKNEPH